MLRNGGFVNGQMLQINGGGDAILLYQNRDLLIVEGLSFLISN